MSDIREKKEVTETKEVIVGCKCDNCGLITHELTSDGYRPKDWHQFNSHHHDWGNDSSDSYEYYDACSPKCFMALLTSALEDLKDHQDTGEIADMPYQFAKRLVYELAPSQKPAQ